MNILDFLDLAKSNLQKDKYLLPAAILEDDNGHASVIGIRFNNESEKAKIYKSLGKMKNDLNSKEILLINDGARRCIPNKMKDEVLENWDTERPLTYPENHPGREEIIIITLIDLKSNKCSTIIQPYKNVNNNIIFEKDFEYTENIQIEGYIINLIMGES